MDTKKCGRCRKNLHVYEFRSFLSRNELHHTCMLCEAELKVEFYQKRVDAIRERRRREEKERHITHEIFESIRANHAKEKEMASCR